MCSSSYDSDASEKKQVQESPSCSEAKYQSPCDDGTDLKYQSASDVKYQSTTDIKYQSTTDIKYQSTSDIEHHNPSDSRYQGTTDTIYQSIYVMSDQKDECIIATEVSPHIQDQLIVTSVSKLIEIH